jgi:cyclophilin family peptidyl-prolyl cis-trans isomerase
MSRSLTATVILLTASGFAWALEPIQPREAVVETAKGSFVIQLLPGVAPNHVRHFATVAGKGGYDGTTFHRIIPRGIIQGGDPLTKDPAKKALYGTGGLGLLKAEFSSRPMIRGMVAAVLRPRDNDSAGNQFFVVLSDQPSLTGKYTIFGEVVSGMDVVDAIGETPVDGDKARERVVIQKVTLRAAQTPSPSPSISP